MKVIIASDYKSIEFKNNLKDYLLSEGYDVVDKTENKEVSFVESAGAVAKAILNNEGDRGIAIDEYGTGSFNIAVKHKGIVCAQVADEHSAKMTRDHNNTSVITIGSKVTSLEIAKRIAVKFIESEYSGGRHQIRVDMLNKMA
jgi:galactose-6-phosphate isomerase